MNDILNNAKFGSNGLIPAVIQDARTREVLTVAYMNKEALQLTLERHETYLWSRSRQELWHKGETSGNTQKVTKVSLDCDNDAVLLEVEPLGPACHTGAYSCFGVEPELEGVLKELYSVIEERKKRGPRAATRRISSIVASTKFSRRSARKQPKLSSQPKTRMGSDWFPKRAIFFITSWCCWSNAAQRSMRLRGN